MMLLHDIFFYSSPNDVFFCMLEGGLLGIKKLGFGQRGFLLGDWEELQVKHLLHAQALIIFLPLVPFCLDRVFPQEAPSLSSHLGRHCFYWNLSLKWQGNMFMLQRPLPPWLQLRPLHRPLLIRKLFIFQIHICRVQII